MLGFEYLRCPVCGAKGFRSIRNLGGQVILTCRRGHPYGCDMVNRKHAEAVLRAAMLIVPKWVHVLDSRMRRVHASGIWRLDWAPDRYLKD